MIGLAGLLAALGLAGPGLTEGMGAGAVAGDLPTAAPANGRLLNERLIARHPAGSPEADLVAALIAEGFDVRPSTGFASLRRMDWLCELSFEVTWTAKAGAVATTHGTAGGVCM